MATDYHRCRSGWRITRHMADIGKAPEGFPRRMQAARALAGLTIEQLAGRLTDEPGLGERSLRNIENGSGSVPSSRRRVIIEACGVPSVFIDADLFLLEATCDALAEIPKDVRASMGDDVLIHRAVRLLSEQPDQATLTDRIDRLEQALRRLGPPAEDEGPESPLPGSELADDEDHGQTG